MRQHCREVASRSSIIHSLPLEPNLRAAVKASRPAISGGIRAPAPLEASADSPMAMRRLLHARVRTAREAADLYADIGYRGVAVRARTATTTIREDDPPREVDRRAAGKEAEKGHGPDPRRLESTGEKGAPQRRRLLQRLPVRRHKLLRNKQKKMNRTRLPLQR